MGVVHYSGHVRVSSLAQSNSRGLERGKVVPVQAKHAGLELPQLGSGPIGSFLNQSPTEPPSPVAVGNALISFPLKD
jgi:hypothetical protein